jgi:RNA polymerase sigma factor (sigma-70 family)
MKLARQPVRAAPPLADDGAVMTAMAQGDVGALGTLYDRYAAQLFRFVCRVAGDQDAADIVHTTFLRVVVLAEGYDASAPSARSWLFAIVLRVVQEHRRSLRRWSTALRGFAAQPGKRAPVIPEERRDLDYCLLRLSPQKRTVLLLAEVEGFTCVEIAAMLAIPIGTVWTRLHHARRELRTSYTGDDR